MPTITLARLFVIGGSMPALPRIFASRPGLAYIEVKKSPTPSYLRDSEFVDANLQITEELLPSDFVVETIGERYKNIIGSIPALSFPQAWGEWVRNPIVQVSAWNHILRCRPALNGLLGSAIAPQSISDAFDSWLSIANVVLSPSDVEWIRNKTVGMLGTPKPIGVKAMPIRIAQKLGRWYPPVQRPDYHSQIKQPEFFPVPVK